MVRKSIFGPDRICAVVAAPTWREMLAQLRRALKLTRLVELRLDWLRNEAERELFLDQLLDKEPRATMIVTCRRRIAGGKFRGSIPSQYAHLGQGVFCASFCGFPWRDVEIETAEAYGIAFLRAWKKEPPKTLVSYHNFRKTPSNLSSLARQMRRWRSPAIKVATQCHSLRDGLRVLTLVKGRRDVVAVPMGEVALPLRVLALREGSALAYAAVGEKTAPGQLTLEEMKHLYRADRLDRRTRVYGVIGNPIGHSLSPLLHNAGFHACRINAVYLPFLVRDLRDFLAGIEPLGIRGFSVTLPHKERVLRYLDDCDPLAAAIGAVNTVVIRGGGKLYGYNTDYVGVLRALERRMRLAGSRVLLFGAGGAARAAAFALTQAGASVAVCARRPERARALARAVGGEVVERRRLSREFFDAIVNATPVGMHPHADRSPLTARELNCRVVFDLIYRPTKTRLLQLAARRGIETATGVDMFVAQGTAQWEIWMGERAPEAKMRQAVITSLKKEAGR